MKILKNTNVEDIIFLDIETVRIVPELEKGTQLFDSFDYKMRYSREAEKFDGSLEDIFKQKAALYAEFAKIVCVTIGKVKDGKLKLKSYYGDDENKLLKEFGTVLDGFVAQNKKTVLLGHAIKGFDLPFLMRRMLINSLELPSYLDIAHLKPWECTFVLDTLELWKSTGFYSASLINIATAFGLPSPKQDMNGSETSEVYYNEKGGLERIKNYCEQDVKTVCNVFLKMRGDSPVDTDTADIVVEKAPLMEKIFNTKKVSKKEREAISEVLDDMNDEDRKRAEDILAITLP